MLNKTGGVIYAYRKLKGMTQEQLADMAGVSTVAVSKWERGVSMPDVEILCRLADYFDTTVDELLGRGNTAIKENERYTGEALEKFAIGEQLLKCSKISKEKGLLAMGEMLKDDGWNPFLKFSADFMLDMMQRRLRMEQIAELMQNYSKNEADSSNAQMITDVLLYITAGEQESTIREIIASHLGAAYRDKFVNTAEIKKLVRDEILERYETLERYNHAAACCPDTHLLDGIVELSDRDIQLILRNLDNQTLVSALCGASGKVCRKFLSNLSDRLLAFIDEDIRQYCGTEKEILAAQKNILEATVLFASPTVQ